MFSEAPSASHLFFVDDLLDFSQEALQKFEDAYRFGQIEIEKKDKVILDLKTIQQKKDEKLKELQKTSEEKDQTIEQQNQESDFD